MARLNILARECDTINRVGNDAETNDPARASIHDDLDPAGPQRCRLAPEQIQTPEAVFHVAQESRPGGTTGVPSRQGVMDENSSHHVFLDLDVECQGHLLGDSRTAPVGITLLHFDNRTCAQVGFESFACAESGLDISVAHWSIKWSGSSGGRCSTRFFNRCQQEETGDENGPADSQCPGVG